MSDVDRWAVSEAVAVIAHKQAANSSLRLFLTQSPVSLAAPQYAEWLRDQLLAARIAAESLVIEIRMDEAIVHSATIGEFCRSLVHHGVSRSEERRVGKECVSTCRFRWSPDH